MAASLKIHLLDMGTEKYGDCILLQLGGRAILIDGGHPGDWRSRGDSPSIPEQLEQLLGHPAPFDVDLLIVTHCHLDHIGCLPTLVGNGDLHATWALVADEKLGFGRTPDAAAPDARTSTNRLAAALREEDHSDLPDADLAVFLQDAANLEQRYIAMLGQLEERGTTLIRYGPEDHTRIETEFADFGLKILGPTRAHLAICAQAIADFSDAAEGAAGHLADAGTGQIASLYRSMVREGDDLPGAEDRPGKGAALNNQSIVLTVTVGQATALLAGDMQFAKPEIGGLAPLMKALRKAVKDASPYKFIKLTHHSSYNGLDEGLLSEWSATKTFAHTGGLNDAGHPDPGVLQILEGHTDSIKWARTDRNGLIGVTFTASGARLAVTKGELNDPTPNGDSASPAATPAEAPSEAPAVLTRTETSADGITEVTASAKLAPDVTRLTVTFDIQRAAAPPAPPDRPQPLPRPVPAVPAAGPGAALNFRLAPGRTLPPLLFVTHPARLANNIGNQEAGAVIKAIRDAGQTVYEVQEPGNPFAEIRRKLSKVYKGVVILGGYDVLPALRLDVLPPSLRLQVGSRTGDADNFIVWNDEIYGDLDGDGLPELPVSRLPDARSPRLVYAALGAAIAAGSGSSFGIRNQARPFAEAPYKILPRSRPLLVSAPAGPSDVGNGNASAGCVYVMLHGSDADATKFWGEDDSGMYEGLDLSNVPASLAGVVFAGCCWGALTVQGTASQTPPGRQPASRVPASSMALSWLHAGARAFVGCTGTHYSPTVRPYAYFGGPMHTAFWERYTKGESPAEALFGAKLDYLQALPHGQTSPNGQAIELKILKQFTCLGLGW